jgi:hypothetical protein
MRMISYAPSLISPTVLVQLLSTLYNRAPLIVDPPPPSPPTFEPENGQEEQMRIATWASRLTATLGSVMDPAATMFLEQTVHAAAQIAASARNPKLEYAISQVLRSKSVSSLVAGYVTPFLCSPAINIPPFPAPIHIAPPRFHGRLIPFIDFDGRKRPPHSTSLPQIQHEQIMTFDKAIIFGYPQMLLSSLVVLVDSEKVGEEGRSHGI